VFGLNEALADRVVKALMGVLASTLLQFGRWDAHIAGDGAVGLAGPRADQICRG
jgi:hypothetical protein